MKFNNIVSKMVWNDRYRKNGESLEENLRRVAKTFAHDKDQEEEFFRAMDNGYFFPAGRSMSNAGIGEMLTYNNCFLAGTKVLTKDGYVNIEDVKAGSLVATEDGSWQPVNEVMVRDYEGDIYHLSGSKLLEDIYCTPNHQFMTNHGWVAAEKLSKNNDMLKTSNMEYVEIGNIEAEAGQRCRVYNISVENIHSYVVNGVIVHNCYVCPIVPDDMNGIFEAVKLGAITHKSGGGIGYDFSYLRPNGSPTSNDAVASGPVSFMHVFNTQTATIQAGSRRGANMGVLNVYHPDIEEFISAKSYEAGILNHFNLSVMIDDDFMEAANDDREIYLHWPVYDDCGRIIKDEKKWKIKKKVRARDIWDKIMRKAYESGEPGVLFYDNMNKDNTTNYKENIISTNPCFSGRMKLLTTEGYKTFKELSDRKSVNIINGKGNVSKDNKVWCSGTKKVVRVMFTNGNNVECTPDHKFLLANGIEWCEAQNLQNKAVKTYPGRGAICCAVVDIGEMEVYDFSEKDEHSGVVEGYVVHNCGEYVAGMVYGTDNTGKQIKSADFGGACNLGSLFIHNFVRAPFTNDAFFDYEALKSSVRTAVHFLDNVIDVNRFPNPVYENYQKNFRTIGLGITGLADACAMLGMPYDSDRAIEFADYLMEQIAVTAYKTSIEMAKENGPFPFFEKDGYINSGFIQKHLRNNPQLWGDIVSDIEKYGIRNARMISVAPVGTLSLTYGNNCSSGVEPIFQTSYKRRVHVGGQEEKDIQTVDLKDYAYSIWENTKDKIDMSEDILFKTALNISVDSHIKMLRTVSYHVDMSVSKCVAKGTKIQTNHGIVNIEDMGYAVGADSFGKPLDNLFVKDMNGDWKKVTSHYSGGIKPTRKIKFANGFTLECSFVHKLMNENGEWVQAVDLKPGDNVLGRDESKTYLIEIKEIENSCSEVYDIEVEDTHSYLIDGIISHNTINVPTEYTFEQTKEIYDNVWRFGIKGCTIFRPSEIRPGVLVSSDSKLEEKKEEHKWGDVLSCSDDLIMKKRRIMGGCGSIHVIAGFDPVTGEVRETYFSKGSTGGCSNFMTGLSRAISMLGRAGVSIEKIKDQLDSTGACPSYATRRATKKDTSAGSCCPMAIGNALMDMYKEVQDELSVAPHDKKKDNCEECIDPQAPIELHPAIPAKRCPECGELLDMEGGCIICRSCGYTKCE